MNEARLSGLAELQWRGRLDLRHPNNLQAKTGVREENNRNLPDAGAIQDESRCRGKLQGFFR